MKYEIELPEDINRRLAEKASETGDDVVHLIRIAVGRFVSEETMPPANGAWPGGRRSASPRTHR